MYMLACQCNESRESRQVPQLHKEQTEETGEKVDPRDDLLLTASNVGDARDTGNSSLHVYCVQYTDLKSLPFQSSSLTFLPDRTSACCCEPGTRTWVASPVNLVKEARRGIHTDAHVQCITYILRGIAMSFSLRAYVWHAQRCGRIVQSAQSGLN